MRSDVVRCGSEGWGVAQRGAVWLRGVRCGSEGCGVAQRGAVWLRLLRIGLLYGRPDFESRLGTPEEALYRADV